MHEAENDDDDSVFCDILLCNCGGFLIMLLSNIKKSIFKVRRASFGSKLRCTTTPRQEKKANKNGLPLMAERSRSGGAAPCPSSNVDCRSPLPTPLLSVGPVRTPRGQYSLQVLSHQSQAACGFFVPYQLGFQKFSFLQDSTRKG